jgi:lysophospholipase L1-like esterase
VNALRKLAVAAMLVASATGNAIAQEAASSRWAAEIERFEAADREAAPERGGVVFVGSSSIRFWDTLSADFPTLAPLNRGFGGSRISDVRYFADRIILAYEPSLVVLYAGENDIAAGRSAEEVFDDYRAIAELVRSRLSETRLVFVSIKPSPRRWEQDEAMRVANALVEAYAAADPLLDFVDVHTPMIGGDGMPRPELFVEDRLHLNAEGYRLWREVIAQYIE